MSTTTQLALCIGRACRLRVAPSASTATTWAVPCRVIDARTQWGADHLRVAPINQDGSQIGPAVWVDSERVTFQEQRP